MEKAKRVATSTPQPLVTPLLDSLGLSSGKKNEQEVYVQAATKCKPTLRPCSVHQTYPFLSSHNEGLSKSWGPQNHPRPSKTIQFPIEHGHVDVGVPHQKKHQKKRHSATGTTSLLGLGIFQRRKTDIMPILPGVQEDQCLPKKNKNKLAEDGGNWVGSREP